MLHVIHGQSVLESFFHFIRYNLNIIYSRMDRKINEKFKHCGICNGNIAYTACVAYPINLCISPCRNSFIWWSDNHEIVNTKTRGIQSFYQNVIHFTKRGARIIATNASQPYIHLVYLSIITSDTFQTICEILDIKREIVKNNILELEIRGYVSRHIWIYHRFFIGRKRNRYILITYFDAVCLDSIDNDDKTIHKDLYIKWKS